MKRKRRHKETWMEIEGYEDYAVSSLGRVKSLDKETFYFTKKNKIATHHRKEKILTPVIRGVGYLSVALSNQFAIPKTKQLYVHRIVGTAFVPNPENKPEINHKNGIKTDNRASNLEWSTRSENVQHTFDVLGRKRTKFWNNKKA